jgi:hypothetical protein
MGARVRTVDEVVERLGVVLARRCVREQHLETACHLREDAAIDPDDYDRVGEERLIRRCMTGCQGISGLINRRRGFSLDERDARGSCPADRLEAQLASAVFPRATIDLVGCACFRYRAER